MQVNIKKVLLLILITLIIGTLVLGILGYFLINNLVGSNQTGTDNIAVINVSGTIVGGDNGGTFTTETQASSYQIMKQINQAKKDESIKAILLRVNSPGGSSAASDAIYRELKKFKETGKPIVVSMSDAAASGGYYISVAANKIYANPATMTGSIGVIMQFTNLEELFDKLGVGYITIKSRPYKDIGNPDREMTTKEKRILNNMVESVYQQFVEVVMEGRDMPEGKVKELADGRIYSGKQAKQLGLVDELGTFYDAVEETAKLAGIKGEPNLIYYNRLSPLERLLGSFNRTISNILLSKILDKDIDLEQSDSVTLYQQLLRKNKFEDFNHLQFKY